MQVVPAVVPRQVELDAVDGELALGDAVRKAADQRAHWVASGRVAREIVRPKGHVGRAFGTAANFDRRYSGAPRRDFHPQALAVGQRIKLNHGPVRHLAEDLLADRQTGGLRSKRFVRGKCSHTGREQETAEPQNGNESFDRHRKVPLTNKFRIEWLSTFGNPGWRLFLRWIHRGAETEVRAAVDGLDSPRFADQALCAGWPNSHRGSCESCPWRARRIVHR